MDDNPLLAVLALLLLSAAAEAAQVQVGASATFTRVEKVMIEGQNLSVANASTIPLTYEVQSAKGEKVIIVD